MDVEVDLEQIFTEVETALAQTQLLKDQQNYQAGDSAEAEICSEPDC